MTMKTIVRAGLIAAALLAAPLSAQAQTAPMPNAASNAVSSFDAYRAAAITAGVIVGATVAVIVTEGLIIPAYAYVTGAGHGYAFVHGAARLFGAISGGFSADGWYMSR